MWVLDPPLLCEPVTGQVWHDFDDVKTTLAKKMGRRPSFEEEAPAAAENKRALAFKRQAQLAE